MTEHEPWPLLTALDELLAREGWQEDAEAISQVESRINHAVGWLDAHEPALAWCSGLLDSQPLPCLRSRDAAAMLEEAIHRVRPDDHHIYIQIEIWETIGASVEYWPASELREPKWLPEAAARTRAALKAGRRMGMWPVKPETEDRDG